MSSFSFKTNEDFQQYYSNLPLNHKTNITYTIKGFVVKRSRINSKLWFVAIKTETSQYSLMLSKCDYNDDYDSAKIMLTLNNYVEITGIVYRQKSGTTVILCKHIKHHKLDISPYNHKNNLIINNENTYTEYDRYPDIFDYVSQLQTNAKNILSFGCSDGAECRTLSDIYFPSSTIYGIDIDTNKIAQNIYLNSNNMIVYITDFDDTLYDIVFCMSVLCHYESNNDTNIKNLYKFETFEKTLCDIDEHIVAGGILCMYDAQYDFTLCNISHKYEEIDNDYCSIYRKLHYDQYN
jgi:hypothetical protein